MAKIKICHICNLSMNGKAAFLCNLLESTDFTRYEVTVINARAESSEIILSRLQKMPVTIVTPPKKIFAFLQVLNSYFRNHYFDICHSHMWDQSGLFLLIAHYHGIPIRVAHSHNSSKAEDRYSRVKVFFRDKVIWNVLRAMIQLHANRFIACSKEAALWLFTAKIIKNKEYVILPNGIDLEKYRYPNRARHRPTEVLFSGRLVYQKNPVFAVQVFSEFLQYEPDAHMTMIGRGKFEKDVREEIDALGLQSKITIVLETNDMASYYRDADLLLFPSIYEGLGIVLIEAQASGLKCLVSDAVPQESDCGLIKFKSLHDGIAQWGSALSDLLRDESLKVDDSRLSRFDVNNMQSLIESVYHY